ncbi:MAG: ribosome recycling factor [Deltaproteobacteria bacterium]|nr:ribosome recycling factor [Deltaproteobacteria bacterium]
MITDIQNDAKSQMEATIAALKKNLMTLRTGRATPGLLDTVRVDYYGQKTPLSQVASVTVQDAGMLIVKPWEKEMLRECEMGIMEANLGLNVSNDGEIVRVPIPALSEERRREFVKMAKTRAEDAKVSIRNGRRDANDMLKAAQKDGDISEDDEKNGLKSVQDLTDGFVKSIDEIAASKEKEIMTV